jgi:hypothetical protein
VVEAIEGGAVFMIRGWFFGINRHQGQSAHTGNDMGQQVMFLLLQSRTGHPMHEHNGSQVHPWTVLRLVPG